MKAPLRIAIVGAGLAGLTAAGLLRKGGHHVTVFEQAPNFRRIGAGIVLGASVAKVMRKLGLEGALVEAGIKPYSFVSRDGETGETLNELVFDDAMERELGGPFLNVHRADLHRVLQTALAPETIRFDSRVIAVEEGDGGVSLTFSNGELFDADMVIGADGIRSAVRDLVFGAQPVLYTGYVALRAVFPASDAAGIPMGDCVKWWGSDRHALSYYMTDRRDEIYLMGSLPRIGVNIELPPEEATRGEFLEAFDGFHPDLMRLISVSSNIMRLPICDIERRDTWCCGRVALIGDACHAVRPFMAAGGSMAIEDAAILARAVADCDTLEAAFSSYQATRVPRMAEVQRISIENTWLRLPTDTRWFFGYDPFAENLANAA